MFLLYKRNPCPGCKGEKTIKKKVKDPFAEDGFRYILNTCPMCKGKGYLDELVDLKEAKSELRKLLQSPKKPPEPESA